MNKGQRCHVMVRHRGAHGLVRHFVLSHRTASTVFFICVRFSPRSVYSQGGEEDQGAVRTQGCSEWRWWMLRGFFILSTITLSLPFLPHTQKQRAHSHPSSPRPLKITTRDYVSAQSVGAKCKTPQQGIGDYGHIAKHNDGAEQTGPRANALQGRKIPHSQN